MKMNITDFCKGRENCERNAVSAYIRRHPELFEKHTKHSGKNLLLDAVAIELLSEKYPLPRPVEVVEDREAQKKIMQLQEVIIKLQAQQAELQAKAALADSLQFMLEDKNTQIEELKTELKEERAAVAAANQKVENLLQRGLLARIRNKEV